MVLLCEIGLVLSAAFALAHAKEPVGAGSGSGEGEPGCAGCPAGFESGSFSGGGSGSIPGEPVISTPSCSGGPDSPWAGNRSHLQMRKFVFLC